jgi:hypothetical protein
MDNLRIYYVNESEVSDRTPFRVVPGHQKSVISDISRCPLHASREEGPRLYLPLFLFSY